jgi:energy-coupling factor transporter ATP-binding protein EcfA2
MTNNVGIRVINTSYSYPNGIIALKKVDLIINKNEKIAIMGRNGAGKSTLMKIMNGLLYPSSGSVEIEGLKTTEYKSSDLTKKVGVMFQNPEHQLFSNTVEDELDYSLKNLHLTKENLKRYKDDVIQELDLEEFLKISPYNLSGGERKRVSIATILCRKPDYLLFDEPTIGQDKKYRQILEDIIKKQHEQGKTIVIITHDIEFAYTNTNRGILLENGSILADGPIEKLLTQNSILEKTSLIQPQIVRFKTEIGNIWAQRNANRPFPINLDEIRNFEQLKDAIVSIHM